MIFFTSDFFFSSRNYQVEKMYLPLTTDLHLMKLKVMTHSSVYGLKFLSQAITKYNITANKTQFTVSKAFFNFLKIVLLFGYN